MGPLPGALREYCKVHVPVLVEHGTPQDGEGNFLAHASGFISRQQADAMDWATVGF